MEGIDVLGIEGIDDDFDVGESTRGWRTEQGFWTNFVDM
jgi:hypothetical protein